MNELNVSQETQPLLDTYISFSKHMEGPTTLAAPLLILNAKKLARQGLLSPHLVFGTPGKVTQNSHIWGGDWALGFCSFLGTEGPLQWHQNLQDFG